MRRPVAQTRDFWNVKENNKDKLMNGVASTPSILSLLARD